MESSTSFPGPAGQINLDRADNLSLTANSEPITREKWGMRDPLWKFRMSDGWRSLLQHLGVDYNHDQNQDEMSQSVAERGFGSDIRAQTNSGLQSTVEDVVMGNCDLCVPRLVALVDRAYRAEDEDAWVLDLTDPTLAVVPAYLTAKTAGRYPGILVPGAAVLLERVSIFVNKSPFARHLNVHDKCIQIVM